MILTGATYTNDKGERAFVRQTFIKVWDSDERHLSFSEVPYDDYTDEWFINNVAFIISEKDFQEKFPKKLEITCDACGCTKSESQWGILLPVEIAANRGEEGQVVSNKQYCDTCFMNDIAPLLQKLGLKGGVVSQEED